MGIEAIALSREEAVSEKDVIQSMAAFAQNSAAERICLISDNGRYIDSTGSSGRWQIGKEMLPLFETGERVCMLRADASGGDYLNFAMVLPKTVTDRKYSVLLLEYELAPFLEVLELKTYGGKGTAYVLDSTGMTLFKSVGGMAGEEMQNYLFFSFFNGMNFHDNPSVKDLNSFKNAVNSGEAGAVYADGKDESYVVSYRMLHLMDWKLVLVVERSAIAGGRLEYMHKVQLIAIAANLFILIVCLAFYQINSRRIIKKSEVQLTSRERIINVLSKNSMGVYILGDEETNDCIFASDSTYSMLGISHKELTGHSLDILFRKLNNEELIRDLRNWDRSAVFEFDRVVFQLDDRTEKKYLRVSVLPPQNGEIVISIIDETVEAKRGRDLEDAVNIAVGANKAKSVFLSNMSHDIRTPMNAVIGFATLALANLDSADKVKDYLSKILSSSNHLLSLINDILDMSRIESGKMKLEETEVNLSEVLHDIKTIIGGQIHAKQLELYMDVLDVTDEDVICDKTRLNQILLNLLSNAIKFTPSGGTVSVRIAQIHNAPQGKGMYEIRVKDTGIGMSEEFAERIFEPFERERTSTVSGIQGTGLGMAITKNIIDMMGGTIEVHTVANKGTEFIINVTFRLQSGHRSMEAIQELAGLRALVVDDDFNTCDSVTKMLTMVGMRSEWTLSGKEAILRSRQSIEMNDRFHAYIIDWRLPDMNGIEVTRQIRSIDDQTPIIILTAYNWDDIEVEARAAGVTAFCAKPMFMSDLRESLLTILGQQKAEDENASLISEKQSFVEKNILLVEDNELNQEIAVEILQIYGFTVETANNGKIAVDRISSSQAGTYDLVLMDVQMPVMDGYEATKQIRSLENKELAGIPIIAMTANAFDEDRKKAMESGMDGFISKPIDLDELITELKRIIAK